jgi:hypothetical protein
MTIPKTEDRIPVECFQHPENIFFLIFWGSLLQRTTKLTSTQIIRIIFFFLFFFLSIGWEVFLSWFLIKFAAQKKKWGESCGVTNTARFFVQKSAIVLFFLIFLLWIVFLCVRVTFTRQTKNVEIHSKLIWFGSLLYRWRGISNVFRLLFNFLWIFCLN